MGVGMALIVSAETVDAAVEALAKEGVDAYVIGQIIDSNEGIILE